jgi:hypothetical protein
MVIGGEGAYAPSPLVTLLKLGVSVPAVQPATLVALIVLRLAALVPGLLPTLSPIIDRSANFPNPAVRPVDYCYLRLLGGRHSLIPPPLDVQKRGPRLSAWPSGWPLWPRECLARGPASPRKNTGRAINMLLAIACPPLAAYPAPAAGSLYCGPGCRASRLAGVRSSCRPRVSGCIA